MKSFYLVRHGRSIWNQESKFTGWANIPLHTSGKLQAQQMGIFFEKNKINIDHIFSSDLARALTTTKYIQDSIHHKSISSSFHWRLNEKHYGTLEGVERQYIRDTYGKEYTQKMRASFTEYPPIIDSENRAEISEYEDVHANIPSHNVDYMMSRMLYYHDYCNGESKECVFRRIIPYWNNYILPRIQCNGVPLIVTHKHAARVLMKYLFQIKDEHFETYELPDGKIIQVFLDESNNAVRMETHSF